MAAEGPGKDSALSQEELDSLFESIEVAQEKAPDRESAMVTLYDFRQGSKLAPDQVREIQEVLQNLARVLRRTLGLYLNAGVWLELKALSQGSGEQYLSNLPDQPVAGLLELLPHTPKAIWHIDAPLAFLALHCMLGGKPERAEVITEREVSPVEAAVLGRLFREIADTWALTWALLGAERPRVVEVAGNLARLDVELRHEQMVMALVEGNIAGVEGRMWLGLPATVLQMILRKGEAQRAGQQVSAEVLAGAGATRVGLQVVLARRRMWLSELQHLEPGMVLELGKHVAEPVTVLLANKPKFAGKTGVQGGRMAVQIEQVVS